MSYRKKTELIFKKSSMFYLKLVCIRGRFNDAMWTPITFTVFLIPLLQVASCLYLLTIRADGLMTTSACSSFCVIMGGEGSIS
jgi:hypothetical protein